MPKQALTYAMQINCRTLLLCVIAVFIIFVQILRNRKHALCFYKVRETQEEVWENEKFCFHSFFEFSQTFTSISRTSIETEKMFSISFRKYRDKKRKNLVYFDHQNINYLYLHHHYVHSWCYV